MTDLEYENEQIQADAKETAIDAKETQFIEDIKMGCYENIEQLIEYCDSFIYEAAKKAVEKEAADNLNEHLSEMRDCG